jgi:hypothetical protein
LCDDQRVADDAADPAAPLLARLRTKCGLTRNASRVAGAPVGRPSEAMKLEILAVGLDENPLDANVCGDARQDRGEDVRDARASDESLFDKVVDDVA